MANSLDKKDIALIALIIVLFLMIAFDICLFQAIEEVEETEMYYKASYEQCKVQYESLSNDYERLEGEVND